MIQSCIIGCKTKVHTKQYNPLFRRATALSLRTQILINLIVLAIVDTVVPIPITAMILIMVLFQRPKWFKTWVDRIYRR